MNARFQIDDINIKSSDALLSPQMLKQEFQADEKCLFTVTRGRQIIQNILQKKDSRLIGIVGPCSIHDPESAIDYAKRLLELQEKVRDTMLLVMRVYFEKPRTIIGWRGLITDPNLDGSYDIEKGLRSARKLLLDINSLGMPTGSEVLDPIVPQYIADLISWAAIGARTTESQTHRQLASGLSMPVGFKNGTSGNLKLAVDAMESTRHPHSFIGIDQTGNTCVLHTKGNPDVHIILRGGRSGANYYEEFVEEAEQLMGQVSIDSSVMIDCSHANSGKNPEKQPMVLRSVINQRKSGNKSIMGFMIESNIYAGSQPIPSDLKELKYGVSITDSCVDWSTTEAMILEAHKNLQNK